MRPFGITTQAGAEIVAHPALYGCTYSLLTHWLPRFGVRIQFADLRDEVLSKDPGDLS